MPFRKSLKIAVLTDLHIVPPGETIIGIDPIAQLRAAVSHINGLGGEIDRVVVTGDIAHYGDIESYRCAKMELDRLIAPATLLIGNHDRREAFAKVFADVALDDHGFVQSIVDFDDWRLVSLDTLFDPPGEEHEIHEGQLCFRRLAWLDKALAGAGHRRVLLFMHHPPHAVGFRGMDSIRLRNDEAFFEVVEKYRNVRHIVCGHVHRTISGTVRGVGFSVFKSPVHQQPMTFSSSDCSLSVPEPAAYGVIFATPTSVIVHTEDYQIASSIAPPIAH